MIDYVFGLLFNDRFTLRDQLLISYSVLVVVSAGVTLGICYGLLYALGEYSVGVCYLSYHNLTVLMCM